MNDEMVFSDEDEDQGEDAATAAPAIAALAPWEVLIVDDDLSIHQVTQLVMADFSFDGRGVRFSNCYSGAEAHALLARPNQFALILLDVVMESEHAGLDLVRIIREDLRNTNVRIVLRTGQPGQAPQEYVIRNYDINDYREKTDLTHAKLGTVFYSALRAYRDLMRLERARSGLRRSIEAITEVCDSTNLPHFCSAVLAQASALLGHDGEGICASRVKAFAATRKEDGLRVLAVTPAYAGCQSELRLDELPPTVRDAFARCMRERCNHHGELYYVCYHRTRDDSESFLYMAFSEAIGPDEHELLAAFSANVAIAYEKLVQREEGAATQDAALALLGEALERRSAVAGAHVQRVGQIAALLAEAAGLSAAEAEQLRQAAPLHDCGHSGVPDAILCEPGPLSPAQWVVMRSHCESGRALLARSELPMLRLAATIAHEHHERWDGGGYPRGLAGSAISLAARIVALADCLDSMVSPRCYRPALSLEQALAQLQAESGKHFDPALAGLLPRQAAALRALYHRVPPD